MLTVKYVSHARDEERVFEAESVSRHGGVVVVNHDNDVGECFGVGADGVEMPGSDTFQASLYVMNRFGATVAKYFVYERAPSHIPPTEEQLADCQPVEP